jgi:hypothetical protein
VKKVILIVATLFGALAVFLIVLVMSVNSQGGLSPSRASLAKAPLIGGLLKVQTPEGEQEGEEAADSSPGQQEMPFLRLSSESALQRITGELEAKRTENAQIQARLQRRLRELEVWELQLKTERENLVRMLQKERAELNRLKEDLERREADLKAEQISIEAAEEVNLKKTSDIYGKMDVEKAAEVLTEMCAGGEKDAVVKIIYLMQDRNAAKILAAITNPELSAEITRQLKHIRQDTESED